MTTTRTILVQRIALALSATCALLTGASALGKTVEVKMLNRNATGPMVYEPDFVQLEPGDSIKFMASTRLHNAASIEAMKPPGAAKFFGKLDEEIEVPFTEPGLYGIQCTPHYTMGMVMLVQVGGADEGVDLSALTIPEDLPAAAKKRFADIVARQQTP